MAEDRGTTVDRLWAARDEHILSELGYVDPNDPKGMPIRIAVRIEDVRANPGALDLRENRILNPKPKEEPTALSSGDVIFGEIDGDQFLDD